jgi:TRAP-type C4-dicarboxylate transport system permease small subunit
VEKFFAIAAGILVLFIVASVNYDIIMRYFLHKPTEWVVDITSLILVVSTMFGTAWVLARERHVRVELLIDKLPSKAQRVLNIFTSIIGVLVCGTFLWYSIQITIDALKRNEIIPSALYLPKWPILATLVIGSGLLTFRFLRKAWNLAWEGKRRTEDTEGRDK